MKDSFDVIVALAAIVLVIACAALLPIAYLMCLNWLADAAHWGWHIPLTWKTWFAALVLFGASSIRIGK